MADGPQFRPQSGSPKPEIKPSGEPDSGSDDTADFEEVSGTLLRSGLASAPNTNPPPALSTPKPAPRAPTETTFGPFALLEKRGEGNMGQVYKARDEMLQRIVALKIIHPKRLGDKTRDAVARFQREAQALAQVSHPNVIAVYRLDREGASWYLAMEYVDGGDLQDAVVSGGPIPPERAVRFVIQAADGLSHVHERNVLHRDIKPSNLLIAKSGIVKVTDFGLAKFTGDSWSDITQSGDGFFGTPDYMSPEQWRDVRETDERSDIYSLGCTLYYLCAGHNLFEDRRHLTNKMYAHLSQPPPSLRGLCPQASRALESIYQKMVAKDPGRRFQSMAEVADSLRVLLSTSTQVASLPQPPPQPQPQLQSPPQPQPSAQSPLAAHVNSIGMTLLAIPSGDFAMGSASSDSAGAEDEKPRRTIRTAAFQLAAHPVTQGQYQAVTGRNPSYFSASGEGRGEIGGPTDRRPVESVSWLDAAAFCNQLSLKEGLSPYYVIQGSNVAIVGGGGYRLPFEREWERACRGGTSTRYFIGDSAQSLNDYAWTIKNSEGAARPVGQKRPNPWGFYDMLGNVWEWCWDWYDPAAYAAALPIEGPAQGTKRVIRGGSFLNGAQGTRPADRDASEPACRDFYLGFRVARG